MQFHYKAVDHNGHVSTGQLQADNPEDLELRLARMGLEAIRVSPARQRASRLHGRNVNRQELITFCFYMEQLLRGGVPLLDGLADLQESMEQSNFKEIISSLYEDVKSGKQLSQAMSRFPRAFDMVFLSLVRAGEESGTLDKVFLYLTENIKWQDELVAQTKKIMIYPAFVGFVVICVIFFIMTQVVPELTVFLQQMEHAPPFHTRLLFNASWFFVHFWYVLLGAPILLVLLIVIAVRISITARYWLDYWKLHVWLFGPILRKIILARFAGFFAMMYASGITVLDSLQLCKATVNNLIIEDGVQKVHDSIAEGCGIGESFSQAKLFPLLVVRMVNIGESTGELDAALHNVSYFYNREVHESIGKIQAMVEPVMTLLLGLILGWVMLSVLGPIYDIMGQIKP